MLNHEIIQGGSVVIDFETRSCVDLRKTNPLIYSIHPSTEPLCIAFKIIDTANIHETVLWLPGEKPPRKLFKAIKKGFKVWAHNAYFEKCIWQNVMVAKYNWPEIEFNNWRCSASMARALSLPGSLERVGEALKLPIQKNKDGHKIMLKLSKPRIVRKKYPDEIRFWEYEDKPEEFQKLYYYCCDDVNTVFEVMQSIKYLSPTEFDYWQLDQTINETGIHCDSKLIDGAIHILKRESRKFSKELSRLTDGAVTKPTQSVRLKKFLNENGIETSSVDKAAIEQLLEQDLPPRIKRVVEIKKALNKSSTAKFIALKSRLSPESRINDHLVYCGALRTRRWSGKGVQLQNLPRGNIKNKAVLNFAIKHIRKKSVEELQLIFGKQLTDIISSCIRPVFSAAPGKILVCSDYSSIEARGLNWLAGDEKFLSNFVKGIDPYRLLAEEIYGIPYAEIGKESFERFVGKQGELALGYQQSATGKDGKSGFKGGMKNKFNIDVSTELAERVVDIYRTKHKKVVELWYGLQKAAVFAIEQRGLAGYGTGASRIKFDCHTDPRCLKMILPSGRSVYYWYPTLKTTFNKYGQKKKSISYYGVDSTTGRFIRMNTYGGKLVENAVQALCRDILAAAMLRVHRAGFPVVLTVHDEIVSEIIKPANPERTLKRFNRLMKKVPDWAPGFPINVEGWIDERYKK